MLLSSQQELVVERFKNGENLFISGPGGSGKTTLIKRLVESTDKNIQVCALTGCAAILLQSNAKTIHSWSGIKLAKGDLDKIVKNVVTNKYKSKDWKKTQILIVDEISMMSKRIFDLLNRIGKAVKKNQNPFGNMQVIFVGDFYQLPPINGQDEDSDKFCFESDEWFKTFPKENHVILTNIYRQTDKQYTDILMMIRSGTINDDLFKILEKRLLSNLKKSDYNNCTPIKLYPVRSMVDKINMQKFSELDDSKEFKQLLVIKTDCTEYIEAKIPIHSSKLRECKKALPQQIDYEIQYLKNNSPLESELKMRIGSSVMCVVNLDMENNICNGSQGVITDIITSDNGETRPIVTFTNGIVKQLSIHYIQSELYPNIMIGQYPLIMAWALTIHKIQGSTLETAEIDVGNNIFEYGQTYVALSRVKSLDGLYLNSIDIRKIKANPKVVNFYNCLK